MEVAYNQYADELQISKQLVSRWNHEQHDMENPEAQTVEALRRELAAANKRAAQAEMERDILKKAVSIFSHPPKSI